MEIPYAEITRVLVEKDHVLKKVVQATHEVIEPTLTVETYTYLLNSIVSQQLSVKVADIIWKRFIDLFEDSNPEAQRLLSTPDVVLREVGLSRQKLKYLKNVAAFSLENDISFEALQGKSDGEVIELLTQISGVGKWTVQMVLMFPMDRRDVFPVDDLGIQTKMKFWYDISSEKKELKAEMIAIAEKWKPYRSLASKYLWASQMDK